MLALKGRDLISLIEIGESGVTAGESEAASAAGNSNVAEFRGREVERGALEAERAAEPTGGVKAGGEEPGESEWAVTHHVHHADAVRAAQYWRLLGASTRRDHVVERYDPTLEARTISPFHCELHGRRWKRCEQARIVHVEFQTARPVSDDPSTLRLDHNKLTATTTTIAVNLHLVMISHCLNLNAAQYPFFPADLHCTTHEAKCALQRRIDLQIIAQSRRGLENCQKC